MAWTILREAWLDEQYWLSVAELQLVSSWNGPEVEVYQQIIDAAGTESLELLARDPLPPLEAPENCERLVLSMDAKQQCGCHFSKLLTDAAWANFEALAEDPAVASSLSDAGSSTNSGTEESTSGDEADQEPHAEEELPIPPNSLSRAQLNSKNCLKKKETRQPGTA